MHLVLPVDQGIVSLKHLCNT